MSNDNQKFKNDIEFLTKTNHQYDQNNINVEESCNKNKVNLTNIELKLDNKLLKLEKQFDRLSQMQSDNMNEIYDHFCLNTLLLKN